MSREIIDDEIFDIIVNTFWNGHSESVQITFLKSDDRKNGYSVMTREYAIKWFELALNKLKEQVKEDKVNPPWWQELSEENSKKDDKE